MYIKLLSFFSIFAVIGIENIWIAFLKLIFQFRIL